MSTSSLSLAASAPSAPRAYLYNPLWDFLLLGGGSLIALLGLRLVLGVEGKGWSFAATLMLANFINHPHFGHSYQIFYRDFKNKLLRYPAELRWRYLVAGIVVPLALAAFFTAAILLEAPRVLGIAANLMFFLVGWHYVKQGYGMAMVDAAFKRAYFSEGEKKALLHNAYATWILSWCLVNHLVTKSDPRYFDIPYFALPVPLPVLAAAALLCAGTTLRAALALYRRHAAGKPLAWNGVLAYAVSLYAWLLVRDPIVLLWIPAFHSLQYLAVVWRYEWNRSRATPSGARPALRLAAFVVLGFGLGYFGFWALPEWLNANLAYPRETFGASLFLYVFWIFINVHHYALDTVMWRKGNPDVQAHLFAHRQ